MVWSTRISWIPMKTAGFVCVSQFPLIPCVLVAELAELERTATTAADFESLKMQHRAVPPPAAATA